MTDEQCVPLGSIARIYSGGTPSRALPQYWGEGIPWVTTTEIGDCPIRKAAESITVAGLENSSAKIAPAGSLLMAMYGQGKTRGKVAPLAIDAAVNQACAVIDLDKDQAYPPYVLASLRHSYNEIRALSNSGSQENLSGAIIKQIPVWLPEPSTQEAIAGVLDTSSEHVATLRQLLEKRRNVRTALRLELLSGRTRLPGFAVPWSVTPLGSHMSFVRSVALSRAQLDQSSPTHYLHYGDIHGSVSPYLDAAVQDMPRAPQPLLGNAGCLAVGDLVFADASEDPAGVAKSVEVLSVPKAGVVPGLHTIAVRFDSRLANGFKAYLQFSPQFRRALLRLAAGTKVLATTRSGLASVEIELPESAEQTAIAEVLRDADVEIEALEARLEKARLVREGLAQELLSGRTRLPALEAV